MGCDIHSVAQVYDEVSKTWKDVGAIFPSSRTERPHTSSPFLYRSYFLFNLLAGVRGFDYAGVEPISEPRGLPEGFVIPDDDWDYHSHSWLLLSEMINFNYDQYVPDTASWGRGKRYRDLLPSEYFNSLDILNGLGPPQDEVRVVFWFDN